MSEYTHTVYEYSSVKLLPLLGYAEFSKVAYSFLVLALRAADFGNATLAESAFPSIEYRLQCCARKSTTCPF